ncbi:phage shock protein PspA [Dokdonella sp.]|uniref:phage shock protein PspA n=1 Tax=Dokdonella sp. TaxID=2291710 RepID=UPI0031C6823F|nr:phage shock protein PspA [Dokdonella sp.]
MGMFSRISDIINSNLNAMLDKAEDPHKVVRLIIQEMEDTLVEVRSAAARAIADRKELERRIAGVSREADEWQRRAELAVSKGRDDLASAALAEKQQTHNELESLRRQQQELEEGLAKLNDDIAALQGKLADARARQQSLERRHDNAAQRLEVRRRVHDERVNNALGRMDYYERRLEQIEGKVEAYDLGKVQDLHREFADLETDDRVKEELAALKARMAADKSAAGE